MHRGSMHIATIVWAAGLFAASSIPAEIPAQTLPDPQQLARFGLTRAWHYRVSMLPRERISTVILHEGFIERKIKVDFDEDNLPDRNAPPPVKRERDAALFVGTDHGRLHCLEADTGDLRWTQSVGVEGDAVYRPAVTDQYVYAAAGTKLLKIDRTSGRVIHERILPGYATAGPAANQEYCFVPIGESIICYELPNELVKNAGKRETEKFVPDLVDGGIRFNLRLPPGRTRLFDPMPELWRNSANTNLTVQPYLYRNQLIAVADDGKVVRYLQRNGIRQFVYENNFSITAQPAFFDRFVFVCADDFGVNCIDMQTGKNLWRYMAGSAVRQSPLPFADDVFVLPSDGGIHAVSLRYGEPTWVNDRANRLVAVSKKFVYAADGKNDVVVIDRKTGGSVGLAPLSDFSISPSNQYNDRLFVSSIDGLIVCMHEIESKTPYFHPQASGIEEDRPAERKLAVQAAGKAKKDADPDAPKAKPKSVGKKPKKGGKDKGGDDAAADESEPSPKGKGKSGRPAGAGGGRNKKKTDDGDI